MAGWACGRDARLRRQGAGGVGGAGAGHHPRHHPRLSAAQSERDSGARGGQSGAAGAAPGPRASGGAAIRASSVVAERREVIPGRIGRLSAATLADSRDPAGSVSGNRAAPREGGGRACGRGGPRRWSGQGAGRPRGPSAAVLPGAPRTPSLPGQVPHGPREARHLHAPRASRSGRRGGESVRGGRGCGRETPATPAFTLRHRLPASVFPDGLALGRFRCPARGGDNRCLRRLCPYPLPESGFGGPPQLRGVPRQDPSQDSQAHCPLDSAQRTPGPADPAFGWSFLRALPSNYPDTRLWLDEELATRVCL